MGDIKKNLEVGKNPGQPSQVRTQGTKGRITQRHEAE